MKYFFFLWALLLIGCQTSEVAEYQNQNLIDFSDTIEIDFSQQLRFSIESGTNYNFNDSLFYYISRSKQGIGFQSLNLLTNEWSYPKYFPLEGPNQWYRISGVQLLTDNTLYHNLPGLFGFQIVNLEDSLTQDFFFKDQYNISQNDENPKEIYYNQADSIIGLPTAFYLYTSDPNYTKEAKIYGLYSLQEEEWLNFIPFADEFHNNVYSSNWLKKNFLIKGDTIFVNYAKSHNIYGFNTKGQLIIEKTLKFDKIQTTNVPRAEDQMLNMIQFEKGGQYTNLFYSRKHRVYFRFFRYLASPPNTNNLLELEQSFQSVRTGIIVANEDLEVQAIETFPIKENGMGTTVHFFKDGELYIWLMNDKEDQELFVSVVPTLAEITE